MVFRYRAHRSLNFWIASPPNETSIRIKWMRRAFHTPSSISCRRSTTNKANVFKNSPSRSVNAFCYMTRNEPSELWVLREETNRCRNIWLRSQKVFNSCRFNSFAFFVDGSTCNTNALHERVIIVALQVSSASEVIGSSDVLDLIFRN